MRFRFIFIFGGSLAVLAALYFTDPDQGVSTGMLLLSLVTPIIALAFAHLGRKALHDYPSADAENLFKAASQSPTGAGLALIALAIVLSALLGLFGKAAYAQPHERAVALAPVLSQEIRQHWPELHIRSYVPALISHESCISYTHSRCWSPTSRLKTQREEGAGLGQLTRAWRQDGQLRFDSLTDMRDRHPALRGLDWATIYQRSDLQIRALVLMSRDNWQTLSVITDLDQRLAMADAAYNGGMGGLQKERRACQVSAGCNPQIWWGHVESKCLKSRRPLYGNRSACDINRHHVVDVHRRMPWYAGLV